MAPMSSWTGASFAPCQPSLRPSLPSCGTCPQPAAAPTWRCRSRSHAAAGSGSPPPPPGTRHIVAIRRQRRRTPLKNARRACLCFSRGPRCRHLAEIRLTPYRRHASFVLQVVTNTLAGSR
eukprot:1187903-Prorocentrum_minimum.AAC.4